MAISPDESIIPTDQVALNYDILAKGGSYTITANPFGLGYTVKVTDGQYPINVAPYVFEIVGSKVPTGTYAVGQGPLHFSHDYISPFDPKFDGTFVTCCFLAGTHIATDAGEVLVESIVEGDLVTVMQNGAPVSLPVKWVGNGSMDTAEFGHRDEAFPVRIRAGAFSDGVPHRDLVVTPEHCILVEGKLIPARMLVNGGSILVDRELPAYRYFHVELDVHGILVAEGLTTESYIDTGNRVMFSGLAENAAMSANITLAAPLVVDRATVEPIWTILNTRAAEIGSQAMAVSFALTDDPALRLLLDDGTELAARWHRGARRMFHIPRGAKPVRLLSRAASPAEIDGPFVDDRRQLGVSVGKLVVWSGLSESDIGVTSLDLEGWHAPEHGVRWTDGNAELNLPMADNDETFVAVDIAATMRYRDEAAVKAA